MVSTPFGTGPKKVGGIAKEEKRGKTKTHSVGRPASAMIT